jgi:hypothetical protein
MLQGLKPAAALPQPLVPGHGFSLTQASVFNPPPLDVPAQTLQVSRKFTDFTIKIHK